MPYQWSPERERTMLLLAVAAADLKPSTSTWSAVAEMLGDGLTPSAVSQKYYKLRKEKVVSRNGQPVSAPTTPTKREGITKVKREKTPTKRSKRAVKVESFDGEHFASSSGGSSISSTEIPDFPFFASYEPNLLPVNLLPYEYKQMGGASGPTLSMEGRVAFEGQEAGGN